MVGWRDIRHVDIAGEEAVSQTGQEAGGEEGGEVVGLEQDRQPGEKGGHRCRNQHSSAQRNTCTQSSLVWQTIIWLVHLLKFTVVFHMNLACLAYLGPASCWRKPPRIAVTRAG